MIASILVCCNLHSASISFNSFVPLLSFKLRRLNEPPAGVAAVLRLSKYGLGCGTIRLMSSP